MALKLSQISPEKHLHCKAGNKCGTNKETDGFFPQKGK